MALRMKKPLVFLLISVCSLLIISTLVNTKLEKSKLISWIGDHSYFETFYAAPEDPSYPANIFVAYSISIYEENGQIQAVINNQGFQTSEQFHANILGDSEKIDFIFADYFGFNGLEHYHKGDFLLTFQLNNGQLYTTWQMMKCITVYITDQETGVFYEKID